MCLSMPAKLLERDETAGKADVDGTVVDCDLTLVPGAQVGDYVLVHAGYAIQQYEEEEALETLAMLKEALAPPPEDG